MTRIRKGGLPYSRVKRSNSFGDRFKYFREHSWCRIKANWFKATTQATFLLLLLVVDPFSLTSYADRVSRDLFVKLQSPFYSSDYREQITVVNFHEGDLPLLAGGNDQWPPTYKEYAQTIELLLQAEPRMLFIDLLFLAEHPLGTYLDEGRINLNEAQRIVRGIRSHCITDDTCQEVMPMLEELRSGVLDEAEKAMLADRLQCFATALAGWIGASDRSPPCDGWARFGGKDNYGSQLIVAALPPVPISEFGNLVLSKPDARRSMTPTQHGGLHDAIEAIFPERIRHRSQPPDADPASYAGLRNVDAFAENPHKANVVTIEVDDVYTLALLPPAGRAESSKMDPPADGKDGCPQPRAVLSPAARMYVASLCRQIDETDGDASEPIERRLAAFIERLEERPRSQMTIEWGLRPMLASSGASKARCFGPPATEDTDHEWSAMRAFLSLLKHGIGSDSAERARWRHPQPAECTWHLQMSATEAMRRVLTGRNEAFEGRYVIVGASARAARDFHETPTHGKLPGAFFHAMALDNLLKNGSDYMRSPYSKKWRGLTFSFDMFIEAGSLLLIMLFFLPGNLVVDEENLRYPRTWRRAACAFQVLLRSVLGALLMTTLLVLGFAYGLNLTPINWISLLSFVLIVAVIRIVRESQVRAQFRRAWRAVKRGCRRALAPWIDKRWLIASGVNLMTLMAAIGFLLLSLLFVAGLLFAILTWPAVLAPILLSAGLLFCCLPLFRLCDRPPCECQLGRLKVRAWSRQTRHKTRRSWWQVGSRYRCLR